MFVWAHAGSSHLFFQNKDKQILLYSYKDFHTKYSKDTNVLKMPKTVITVGTKSRKNYNFFS